MMAADDKLQSVTVNGSPRGAGPRRTPSPSRRSTDAQRHLTASRIAVDHEIGHGGTSVESLSQLSQNHG